MTDRAFLNEMEKGIRAILKSSDVSTSDRLKAIEIGSKLLMIRHRIEGSEGGEDGKFFSKSG